MEIDFITWSPSLCFWLGFHRISQISALRLLLYQKAEISGGVACVAAVSFQVSKDNVKCLRVCEILAERE